ncbi:MAG: formate dehydrogenase accessory sulfurtransferase FdhD [Alphaproteobacteria bacterium]|nr:formate dehydrogenase accessory sulfurtransferase FdhD [Alphaproteobacteria bacterium]
MSGVRDHEVVRGPGERLDTDALVVEEPLEIRVEERSVAVTMRTPGDDLDLAAGFLCTEGIVDGADDLHALDHLAGDPTRNIVVARVAGGVEAHLEALSRATREFYATSACGICGKTSIDRITTLAGGHAPTGRVPSDAVLAALPDRVVGPSFRATGGLHAAALVDFDGALEVLREDIGRHNAVDKVIGWRLRRDRLPIRDRVLVVSGRTGFEIVQKAAMVQIPVICGIGAASTLAVDLARETGTALYGFVREDRWTRYC